jgi:hypothetical protein
MNPKIAIGLMIVAMLGAAATLVAGLITMASGKDITGKTSNKLMWMRIYFQAGALALFAVVMFLLKG